MKKFVKVALVVMALAVAGGFAATPHTAQAAHGSGGGGRGGRN